MSKDYVVVTCILSHRIRYVMHKDDLQELYLDAKVDMIEWANDTVTMEECEEFSQKYMGEYIVDTNLLSEEEMLELFDKDNDYLKDWAKDFKVKWIRNLIHARKGVYGLDGND